MRSLKASGDRNELIRAVHDALYCSEICAYAQGFQLMRAAQTEYAWKLDFASIASIWRGGGIFAYHGKVILLAFEELKKYNCWRGWPLEFLG